MRTAIKYPSKDEPKKKDGEQLPSIKGLFIMATWTSCIGTPVVIFFSFIYQGNGVPTFNAVLIIFISFYFILICMFSYRWLKKKLGEKGAIATSIGIVALLIYLPFYFGIIRIGNTTYNQEKEDITANTKGKVEVFAEAEKKFTETKAKAETGDAEAQASLGYMYANGEGVWEDDKEAAKWFRKAAEQGHADAQFNLGLMYDIGEGVLKDDKEAVKWYRKAAVQGDARVQNNLGNRYTYGKGVPKNAKEAVKWFRKAAEQGYADAQFNLGLMYFKGQGVLGDGVTAYAWWNLAAANGFAPAKKKNDITAKSMNPAQIAKAEMLSKEMLKKNPKLLKQ